MGKKSSDERSYLCMDLNLLLENKRLALDSIKIAKGKSNFLFYNSFLVSYVEQLVKLLELSYGLNKFVFSFGHQLFKGV